MKAKREGQRARLMAGAERVFAHRGYEGAKMQEVADEAKLALATVYTIAGSKEELYAELHRVRGRALLEAAAAGTQGAGSAWSALRGGMRAYAEYLVANPSYLQLHLRENQPWALAPRFTTQTQGRLWQEGLELLVQAFIAAIAEGSIVDENPALLARLTIAAHQVFLGEWVGAGMKESPASLLARMEEHVERAFAKRGHGNKR
jgi:TetR/AcrR family transcriptional regulator